VRHSPSNFLSKDSDPVDLSKVNYLQQATMAI